MYSTKFKDIPIAYIFSVKKGQAHVIFYSNKSILEERIN